MRFRFLALFVFGAFFVQGQTADSLLSRYASYPDDTAKVSLLYEKAFSFRNTDLPAAIKLAKACYRAALHTNNKYYLAKALNLTGVLRSETGFQQEALADLKKALELRIQTRDTLSQAIILNNIGNVYSTLLDHKQALQCYEQALLIAKSVGNERWTHGALFSIAEMQTNLQMFAQAEGNFYTLIGWAQKKNDYEILGMCYMNMSLCKLHRGDTTAAEAYQMQALDIAEMTEDDILKADVLCALGNLYSDKKNYKESLQYLQKANSIYTKNNYREGSLQIWKGLSELYKATNSHKEAFVYLAKHDSALAAMNEVNDDSMNTLWKEMENVAVENNTPASFLKNNIFECVMIGALVLLLLVVIISRSNEQKI